MPTRSNSNGSILLAAIRLTSVFFLVVAFSSSIQAHPNQQLADTIEALKPSVVAIGTMRPVKRAAASTPPVTFRGSGFVVGDGRYVVTNLHVLPDKLDEKNDETLAIFSGRGRQARGVPVSIVRKDAAHDLVLLRMKQGRLKPMLLGDSSFVREGTEVALTGFPIGMVLGLHPVTHRGIVSAITPLVIPAASSRNLTAEQIRRLKEPFEVYQLDVIAYPGNSGSAVYDLIDQKVVGVVNSVFVKESKEALLSSPSGITYVIPVRYVHELMDGR